MKLQKTGGVASIAYACLAAFFIVILAVVFPRLGLGPNDYMDPAKSIAAWSASPGTFFSLDIEWILFGIAFLLLMLALRERMQAEAPILTQIALAVTYIACAFWLGTGLVNHAMRPTIIGAQDASAFRGALSVTYGLSVGGYHALGWALLLMGWAALKTARLPRMLASFILLAGLVLILEFVSMALVFVVFVVTVILSLWLGIVLLRARS